MLAEGVYPLDVVRVPPFSIDEEKNTYLDTALRSQRDISTAHYRTFS